MTVRRACAVNPMDDCLVLLQHVATHPDERQTTRSLGLATGVDYRRVHALMAEARENQHYCMIARAACKYRFDWDVYPARGRRILDAVYRGYG